MAKTAFSACGLPRAAISRFVTTRMSTHFCPSVCRSCPCLGRGFVQLPGRGCPQPTFLRRRRQTVPGRAQDLLPGVHSLAIASANDTMPIIGGHRHAWQCRGRDGRPADGALGGLPGKQGLSISRTLPLAWSRPIDCGMQISLPSLEAGSLKTRDLRTKDCI